jgi:hypothetical protein
MLRACVGCRDYLHNSHLAHAAASHPNAGHIHGDQRNATWSTGWSKSLRVPSHIPGLFSTARGMDGAAGTTVANHPDARFSTLSLMDHPEHHVEKAGAYTSNFGSGSRVNRASGYQTNTMSGHEQQPWEPKSGNVDINGWGVKNELLASRKARYEDVPEEVASVLVGNGLNTLISPAVAYVPHVWSQFAPVAGGIAAVFIVLRFTGAF